MSTWQYKLDDQQLGPVSFAELAELVREGKVSERTQVSRAGTMNWEPAWHVPGLFRAAGIAVEGDSPLSETPQTALTPALSRRERETEAIQNRKSKIQNSNALSLLPSIAIAAAIGLLAVGFFYRWAWQATIAFPMPPTIVDGELIDCYFPLVGRCTVLECGLLYLDVFAVAAVATWHAVGKRVAGG